ncbi:hypothetical protein Tco_0624659 [Tanacetum coccineum]|uniref:RNA-directed DNA polymerase, eukaryota n=1 Tax=Tanacetum coccineum TaxID=301880 RepID=A0ABQ4WEN1_9ASTR
MVIDLRWSQIRFDLLVFLPFRILMQIVKTISIEEITSIKTEETISTKIHGVSKTDFERYVTANDAVLRNMQNPGQNLAIQMAKILNTDMLSKFVTANTASTSGSGTLPGNTITNPKEDLKGITTRSGVTIQGPKAVNHDTEVTKDTMLLCKRKNEDVPNLPVCSNSVSSRSSERSKLEYKFQDKENSEDIFSFGSALEDFICVVFVHDRNIVIFIGEWSIVNLSGITHILHCFSLLSGLSINLKKSHLLGVGIRSEDVNAAALYFGCSTMKTPFKYLGVMVGGNSSTLQAWDDTIGKLKARLSNWKLKTLSVGGRLTLLKSVLGSTPIYNMSIYKAKVLASKKYGGLGVSSFYALNRALLFKWVWRFISRDNSLWCRLIMSMHGSSLYKLSPFRYSTWKSIIREVHMLKDRGVDLISHCHIRVGNGLRTQFWNEVWIGDTQLRVMFPRIYALEINKDCTVADKLQFSVTSSLRRSVRGGVESSQLALLQTYIEGTLLSNMEDRWVWDLNGEGVFRVKDVRILLDECFLPKAPTATRWVKYVPIKINVFAWKVFLDRKIPRTCSSVVDWLRISSGSYVAGGIYHGLPLGS